jgi:hypothetical protein
MAATWLADALRAGGLPVNESIVPDWKQRGHTDGPFEPIGVLAHHTAGPRTGDLPSLAIVRDGNAALLGPRANLMLTRSGVFVPIAAGRAWHAGAGSAPWVPHADGNRYLIGIEAESSGVVDDWTPAQRTNYPKGVAALLKWMHAGPDRVIGHKEWAPGRKPDPAFWDMDSFRASVAGWLIAPSGGAGESAPIPAPQPPAARAVPSRLAWNLPPGHYYGNKAGPVTSHGGFYAAERPFVQNIQQWLIYHGCVPGVGNFTSSGWDDGIWEAATDVAMANWHARCYPGQPHPAQCWVDDYARLARA